MLDAVRVGEEGTGLRELIDVRRAGAADDLGVGMVLLDHHHDVVGNRQLIGVSGSGSERGHTDQEALHNLCHEESLKEDPYESGSISSIDQAPQDIRARIKTQ